MKKFFGTLGLIILLLALHRNDSVVYAACSWPLNGSSGTGSEVMAASCTVDAATSENYDYSSGADDATNGYAVTLGQYVITINSGTDASHQTILGVGSFSLTGTGSIAVAGSFTKVNPGAKCYVLDSDGDLYSPTPTTCSTTGGAGYVRKNKLAATTVDCGDGDANAKPGQTTYFTGTFVNGVNALLTHDWNCDGTETQQYTAVYACNACTNGSGYASTQNTVTGFASVPACGVSGTYYTVTNSTCQDPAAASCTGAYTTSTVTQACR